MTGSLAATRNSREELKTKLFEVIDKDGDDLLNKGEMRELAKLVGFDGSDEEWSQEYLKLCQEVGATPAKGIPKVVVLALLDDRSETGCFCTEEDLKTLLMGLERRGLAGKGTTGKSNAKASKNEKKPRQDAPKSRNEGTGDNMVFFQGVPLWTTEDAIRNYFRHVGEVASIQLFRLKDGTPRGMGYVTYGSGKQASRAVKELHQGEMDGHEVQVHAFDHQEEKRRTHPATSKDSRRYVAPPAAMPGRTPPPAPPVHSKSTYEGWYGGEDETDWYEWKGSGAYNSQNAGYPTYGASYGYDAYGGYEGYDSQSYSDGRALYFLGAPFDMSQEKLRNMFQEYGATTRFWLFRLPDGRSRGQGLVEYSTRDEARYAIHYLDGRRLGDRTLKVQEDQVGALDQHAYDESFGQGGAATSYARWDTRSVFFSGAPSLTPFRIVQSKFEEYGEVEMVNMFRHSNGKARGMGVVTFVRADAALQVLMSGIEVDGWQLFLKEADQQPGSKADGNSQSKSQYSGGWNGWAESYASNSIKVNPSKSLYFANVAYDSTDDALRHRFGKFGSIKTLHMLRTKTGQFKGKGIVEYSNSASAHRAYDQLHHAVFNGRRMVVDEFRPEQLMY